MQTILTLKKGRESALGGKHPWIFSGALSCIPDKIEDGTLVQVRTTEGDLVCTGHFQNDSIAVKVLDYGHIESEEEFLEQTLEKACRFRRTLGLVDNPETTAFRLVHGEGDFLPGLIIDVYGEVAVIQFHSAGMRRLAGPIASIISRLLPGLKGIYNKPVNERGSEGNYIFGSSPDNQIRENDLRFIVDWENGQKTGFYVDQRENRRLVRRLAGGRRVLNAFCYTGAFSVYAFAGGAESVTSVDSSETALHLLEKNLTLNFDPALLNHESVTADCLRYLKEMPDTFNLIILDPPAFIKHRGAYKGGIQGYRSINSSALRHIEPGGLLFTFSCSQLLSQEDFREILRISALEAGRSIRILHHASQAPCHPVNIFHPEGSYLKGLVVEVL